MSLIPGGGYIGEVAHHGLLVVGRQVLVAGDGRHGGEAGQVVLAATSLRGRAWTQRHCKEGKGKLQNEQLWLWCLPEV